MINFLKYRPVYWIFSFLIFAVIFGVGFYKHYTRGSALSYSVEFTGGTQADFALSKPVHSEELVKILQAAGFKGIIARDFSGNEVLFRVAEYANDSKGLAERMKETLEAGVPGLKVEIKQVDSVGPDTGSSLWLKSLLAIIIGLLLMLMYTWVRFWSLSYGIGVWASLFHDAIVIIGFFMLFDYEISSSVIAALLAILGYSINDSIVVLSRIRENVGKLRNMSMDEIANISINETLRRTLLTSFATALVVFSLLIFGGQSLRPLSIALFVGIVFGTYSSVAIAIPSMLIFYREKP